MLAMPWDVRLPTEETKVPSIMTSKISHRTPIVAWSGREACRAARVGMDVNVLGVTAGTVVSPRRGYDRHDTFARKWLP